MSELNPTVKEATIRELVSEFEKKLVFFSDINFKHLKLNEVIQSSNVIEEKEEILDYVDLGVKKNLERCLKRMGELLNSHLNNTDRTSELIG